MSPGDEYWLDILRHNRGFSQPHQWVSYAAAHGFRKVAAEKLDRCPDCTGPSVVKVGQYVYYSTLVVLYGCKTCGLVFSDTRIDADLIRQHFESAYKDEEYLGRKRAAILDHVAEVGDGLCPHGGRVIDIGGAHGHLLAALRRRRPDVDLTLCDMSTQACTHAESQYRLRTICATIPELVGLRDGFDLVLMIDVLYYEPEIQQSWKAIAHLAGQSGTVVMRLPNRLPLIKAWQQLARGFPRSDELQSSLRFFNPEHLYIFSTQYLRARLASLGFRSVEFLPSPLLSSRNRLRSLSSALFGGAHLISELTRRRLTITPSFLVVARRSSTPLHP